MSRPQEGWRVQARPLVLGLALFVTLLVALVTIAGRFYVSRFAARTRPTPHAFPHPQLETVDSAPSDRNEPSPPAPPPDIAKAMAETAARGDALWSAQ